MANTINQTTLVQSITMTEYSSWPLVCAHLLIEQNEAALKIDITL